jgi:chromosome partitioning protein
MSKKATIIAVVNQKGGTGKTTTTENLGVGLALEGKKVLLVDTDPQASLTVSLGNPCPDDLSPTLSDLMGKIMMENPITPDEGILHHPEGVDLVPSNIELSGMEVALVNAMSRETILRQYLDTVKQNYDYILLDCMPSLGMLTVNALAAADNVLIPVQAAYLPAKGLEQLLGTINKVKRQINPKLRIEGILLTMVDSRTNYSKDISNLIRESYGGKLKVYKTDIPRSVRAEEISAEGHSIFQHDPKGKVLDLINASEAREDGWLSDRRGSVLACRWYWNDGENERPPCYFVFIPINLVHIVCFSCKLLFSFRLLSAGFSASFGINHIRLNFATPGIRFSSHSF